MKDFKALARAQWKGFWRDKQNWFWLLAFPLMFLFLFGFLFKDAGASKSEIAVVGDVGFVQEMPADAKKQFNELFDTTSYKDRDAALEAVRKGDLDGAVEGKGRTLVLHYSGADQVVAAQVQGTFQGFVQSANIAVSGRPPTFTLKPTQVEDEALKPIQFLAPGLLGWAVAMGATFNIAMPMVTWRTNQLLRRLRLSPVRIGSLISSRMLVSFTVAMLQTAIFLILGVTVFGLQLSGMWWLALPLILLGTLAFMAVGMLIGAVSKTVDAASGLANVVLLPMAFLSGSFIPLDQAPDWLSTVSKVLPLGQLNDGMLDVMVRGEGPSALVVPALTLLGFTAVFGLIAAKLFRWDDKQA
ncbi:ABC transporter permease [Demetria terragena]|uniref:ABC transporter permease n=1 Tax=Demetria terragena TaxID=63959 RepID=UPI00036DC986|nr:ABC transporter permease [Demetria terragena]